MFICYFRKKKDKRKCAFLIDQFKKFRSINSSNSKKT